jgi:hypothetical protein
MPCALSCSGGRSGRTSQGGPGEMTNASARSIAIADEVIE